MNSRKILTAIGAVVLIGLASGLACYGLSRARADYAQIELERTAHRLGIEPFISSFGNYIVGSVEVGMSRDQVEQALRRLGTLDITRGSLTDLGLRWGPAACDKVSLKLDSLVVNVWRISACYNSKGELVLLKSMDQDLPSLNIHAP